MEQIYKYFTKTDFLISAAFLSLFLAGSSETPWDPPATFVSQYLAFSTPFLNLHI